MITVCSVASAFGMLCVCRTQMTAHVGVREVRVSSQEGKLAVLSSEESELRDYIKHLVHKQIYTRCLMKFFSVQIKRAPLFRSQCTRPRCSATSVCGWAGRSSPSTATQAWATLSRSEMRRR